MRHVLIGYIENPARTFYVRPFGFVSGTISGQCHGSFCRGAGDHIPPREKKMRKTVSHGESRVYIHAVILSFSLSLVLYLSHAHNDVFTLYNI